MHVCVRLRDLAIDVHPSISNMPSVIPSVSGFLGCLRRLHNHNDAVMFWNHDKDFRIMIRNDPCDDVTLGFEICIIADEDDDICNVLQLSCLGPAAYCEDDTYVLETYSLSMEEVTAKPSLLEPALECVNSIFNYSMCPCGDHLIKDDSAICYYCQLSSSVDDMTQAFCFVCHQTSIKKHMKLLDCCHQYLHRACLEKWENVAADASCPHCRST